MEDEHVIPAQDEEKTSSKKPKKGGLYRKKLLAVLGFVVLVLLVAGGSFWFGRQRIQAPEPSPTPTPTEAPEEEEEEEPIATDAADLSPTSSPTPTSTPTPTPTPTPITKTISSTTSLDGFRCNNNGGNDGLDVRAGNGAFVGAPSYELVCRGFLSFDVSPLPSAITVEKATLRLYQQNRAGTPYAGGNSLIVDHVNYGSSLGSEDYDPALLASNIGTLTSNPALEWKDLDVTDEVKNDLSAGRTRSQFRSRFSTETDGDGSEDMAYFESSDNSFGTGNRPQLVVVYHIP